MTWSVDINMWHHHAVMSHVDINTWHHCVVMSHVDINRACHVDINRPCHVDFNGLGWTWQFYWRHRGGREAAAPVLSIALSCSAQAVEINMTWSVDINMTWSVDINMWHHHAVMSIVDINMTWTVDINMTRTVDITGELKECRWINTPIESIYGWQGLLIHKHFWDQDGVLGAFGI